MTSATRSSTRTHAPARSAFTLVEMLVAVTLVMLMMSLFAQVFQMATGSMSTQKGIAENDQRARTLVNLIRADLDKRTYRDLFPSAPNVEPTDLTKCQGYFYLSENDEHDDTDDVLQFTLSTSLVNRNTDQTPLYGRATILRPAGNTADPNAYFLTNPNQPEAEDLQVNANSTGSSAIGEVAYFLRNNILYRRVQLVREHKKIDSAAKEQPSAGSNGIGTEILDSGTPYSTNYAPNGVGNFLTDFDYSAYWNNGVKFHAAPASLDNKVNTTPDATLNLPISLGIPHLRFGHNILNGQPREFVSGNFIGRFTHEETSHNAFVYPGNAPSASNPMGATLTFDPSLKVVSDYIGGPRRGEDIVMTNVYAFDIKVFDHTAPDPSNPSFYPAFRDLGYASVSGVPDGIFAYSNISTNAGYGPRAAPNNRVFDTWHPDLGSPPPFRPTTVGLDGMAGTGDDVPQPLKAIQIKIRFLDTSSNQLREVTIVQSLVDG